MRSAARSRPRSRACSRRSSSRTCSSDSAPAALRSAERAAQEDEPGERRVAVGIPQALRYECDRAHHADSSVEMLEPREAAAVSGGHAADGERHARPGTRRFDQLVLLLTLPQREEKLAVPYLRA